MKGKITIIILLVIGLLGFVVYDYYTHYQYDKQIGSYMNNAIDMVAPEPMLVQVQSAKQGMIDAGLTNEDYGALIFKKPDNSMKFQYQHIDAIIERINAVIDWKTKVYSENSTSSETLGDVYETKMTNLRQYIKGETLEDNSGTRSDWIAENAWFVKYHIILYFDFTVYILLLSLIGILLLLVLNSKERKREKEPEETYY